MDQPWGRVAGDGDWAQQQEDGRLKSMKLQDGPVCVETRRGCQVSTEASHAPISHLSNDASCAGSGLVPRKPPNPQAGAQAGASTSPVHRQCPSTTHASGGAATSHSPSPKFMCVIRTSSAASTAPTPSTTTASDRPLQATDLLFPRTSPCDSLISSTLHVLRPMRTEGD